MICISVNKDSLEKEGIKYDDIEYKKEINIEGLTESFIESDRWLIKLLLEKKECFSYEKECRIYKPPTTSDVTMLFRSGKTTIEDRVMMNYLWVKNKLGTDNDYLPFSIEHINTVQVHPSSSREFEEDIEELCKQYLSLEKFIGRSKILD